MPYIVPEIQGESIEYIAKYKAEYAARQLNCPVIIEDTALCFEALQGLPGPYIKWFLERLGHDGLVRLVGGFEGPSQFRASAICTLVYYDADSPEGPVLFQGITQGTLVPPRGPAYFGWDPIFQPDHPSGLTYAEMEKSVKNGISHRSKALEMLKCHFRQK